MSSPPHHDDSPRPMPTRLLSSLKRPFSRPKNDHDRNPSSPERTRGPIHGEAPPNYQQIAMGLHLSRTPHFPTHIAHLYPPSPQPRLHRSPSSPSSSSTPPRTPPRTRASSLSLCPPSSSSRRSRSHAHSPPRSPSRLLPPPARSALKKPRAKAAPTTSSSVTPDTASASTVASSVLPQTPTRSLARSGGLLARFLGKERGHAARALVVLADETVRERKAVRFGGLEEEDES
ncbi:hypothetical protein EDB85DRAFT_1959438 [Lactarius pseudohatsudake]|nr:hypothetical protein EDB85DRAFT_1959438 [Lactarius pseudohatsudake]